MADLHPPTRRAVYGIVEYRWICYKECMERGIAKIIRQADQTVQNDYVHGTPQSRLALVWPLTREVTSLSKHHHAERRLQRDVAVLSRRGR